MNAKEKLLKDINYHDLKMRLLHNYYQYKYLDNNKVMMEITKKRYIKKFKEWPY